MDGNRKHSKKSNHDTRSLFSENRTKTWSQPQAFAKVTYHGFFKCEGNCYPITYLELCWKILMFIIFHNSILNFCLIITTDVIVVIVLVFDGITNVLFYLLTYCIDLMIMWQMFTLKKAMVGDLGESLWLRSSFGSVLWEKRPCVMIR